MLRTRFISAHTTVGEGNRQGPKAIQPQVLPNPPTHCYSLFPFPSPFLPPSPAFLFPGPFGQEVSCSCRAAAKAERETGRVRNVEQTSFVRGCLMLHNLVIVSHGYALGTSAGLIYSQLQTAVCEVRMPEMISRC